jgi:hypothetical protein
MIRIGGPEATALGLSLPPAAAGSPVAPLSRGPNLAASALWEAAARVAPGFGPGPN